MADYMESSHEELLDKLSPPPSEGNSNKQVAKLFLSSHSWVITVDLSLRERVTQKQVWCGDPGWYHLFSLFSTELMIDKAFAVCTKMRGKIDLFHRDLCSSGNVTGVPRRRPTQSLPRRWPWRWHPDPFFRFHQVLWLFDSIRFVCVASLLQCVCYIVLPEVLLVWRRKCC